MNIEVIGPDPVAEVVANKLRKVAAQKIKVAGRHSTQQTNAGSDASTQMPADIKVEVI